MQINKKEQQKKADAKWRANNREKYNAIKRKYYNKNREKILEMHKQRRIKGKPTRIRMKIQSLQKQLEHLLTNENILRNPIHA